MNTATILENISKCVQSDESVLKSEVSQRSLQVQTLRDNWGAPLRHSNRRLKDLKITGAWGKQYVKLKEELGQGFLSVLTGIRGNGKTQMGVQLMLDTTFNLTPALYLEAMEFYLLVKETFADNDKTERAVIERLRKPKLLVIDEFGKRGETEWHSNLMFYLLNKRYGDGTDTLLIDNRTEKDFTAAVGPSLASRMKETGGIIVCDWESFR